MWKPVAESLIGFADLTGLHAYNGLTAIARTSSNMEDFYTHIEGISRESSHVEIFYVGTNGNFNPLRQHQFRSGMTVLARSNFRKNIFYIGNDNRVYQGYWKVEQPTIWRFEKLSDFTAAPGSLKVVSMNS
ncbi:uncharacterized protein Triagg1_4302 [Trichoderma aggressivum f. europaeum]|uniref:Uncharacterized protein n=1 Tax=Trichoderma aggressivum f. europaeum TaxID=173218 RepID=A0AAE1J899_9HYPO|nr:hypothetical protein Triagg1_4302 [Trichoderma aggressivum f. europaeum]